MSINDLSNKAIEFIKTHYEYVLPFSLFFLIVQLPPSLIQNQWTIPFSILLAPLSFSIPFFADKLDKGSEKSFGLFFEVYTYFFKYLGINVLKLILIGILFIPAFVVGFDIVQEYDYNIDAIIRAIQLKKFLPPMSVVLAFLASSFILLLLSPLLLFVEFFAILDDIEILKSFKLSFQVGLRNYFKVLGILALTIVATIAGMCTCGIGLVLAIPFIYLLLYYAYKDFRGSY